MYLQYKSELFAWNLALPAVLSMALMPLTVAPPCVLPLSSRADAGIEQSKTAQTRIYAEPANMQSRLHIPTAEEYLLEMTLEPLSEPAAESESVFLLL